MKRKVFSVVVFLTACLAASAQYNFSTLTYPGGDLTRAYGLNSKGQIVGSARITPPRHAYVWDSGAYSLLDADGVLSTSNSEAYGINDKGDVVGTYTDLSGVPRGYIYSKGSLTTLMLPFGEVAETYATGINNQGEVVGYWVDASGYFHGFYYFNGEYERIEYPGALDTLAYTINQRGVIVGNWDTDNTTLGHGFVQWQGSRVSFDHPRAAANSSTYTGSNDWGQFVGIYIDENGQTHDFVQTGSNFSEVVVPGADTETIRSINNRGEIVGNYTREGVRYGFLATPNRKGE
jgi:probable HAF family extracellular repeat protein